MANPPRFSGDPVLLRQTLGFSLMVVLMWLVEIFHLPHLLYGDPSGFNWPRVLGRSATIIVIWFGVHLTTKRLLRRLHQLEEYLLICSWCRKVGDKGEWLTLEEYFSSNFDTATSHGICPECAEKQLAKHRASLHGTAAGGKPPGSSL